VPSFLLNSKMNPALRARVERSLRGRSSAARLPPGFIAVLRWASVVGIVVAVAAFVTARRERAQELAAAKAELVQKLSREAAGLSQEDWQTLPRAEEWLRRASGNYAGDTTSPALKDAAAVERLLRRPALYVRGELAALAANQELARALARSAQDTLLWCLLTPPASAEEKDVSHALNAPRDGVMAPPIERLDALLAGLPLLKPEWTEQLQRVTTIEELRPLRDLIAQAPLAEAKRAAHAEVLLFALDEPKEAGTAVELDGTHRHAVRFHVVDLRADQELVRLRRTVDPAWVSEQKRPRAGRLVDCRLGFDLRAAMIGK
jgi:hypothetical protein